MKQGIDMPALIDKIKSRSSNNVGKSMKFKVVTPKLSTVQSRAKLLPPTYDVDDTGKP